MSPRTSAGTSPRLTDDALAVNLDNVLMADRSDVLPSQSHRRLRPGPDPVG